MTVDLTSRGQELVDAALARGVGRSPAEVIEQALEAAAVSGGAPSEEKNERRRQAVAGMLRVRG